MSRIEMAVEKERPVDDAQAEALLERLDLREMRPEPAYFTLLALIMWIATTWFNTTSAMFPLARGIETLALTASNYLQQFLSGCQPSIPRRVRRSKRPTSLPLSVST